MTQHAEHRAEAGDGEPGRALPAIGRAVDWLASRGVAPYLALLVLSIAVYLPGVLRLPAVDRTEIVFADTTRGMVERGAWLDPRYGSVVHQFRPIGTFWAQAVAATAAGSDDARNIAVYRLPSLIAVALTVLALFWLSAPRVGRKTALIAAGIFAVAPLTVLISQLAIADGLALLPASVAMLALLRLYDPEPGQQEQRLALLFWLAMGLGMLVNALHTPILVGVTLIALFILHRDLSWLRRTRPLVGVPVALLIAAPWLAVRALQDGMPFAGLGWRELLAALGGAQDMKLRAFPGTFTAAALIGFVPGVALLPPAIKALWDGRANHLPRFLLAWIIGYIAYLELVSSKPGTYTVQVMFPAFALAVALLVVRAFPPSPRGLRGEGRGEGQPSQTVPAAAPHPDPLPMPEGAWGEGTRADWSLIPWPPLSALFAVGLFAAVFGFVREWPDPPAAVLTAIVAALFAWSAHLGRSGDLLSWAVSGTAALALFAITLLGVVLPGVSGIWPAREASRLVAATCGAGQPAVLGFREPSASFVLGAPMAPLAPTTMPVGRQSLHLVESRWLERYRTAMADQGHAPAEIGCVEAFNVMRGCPVTFTLLAIDPQGRGCTVAPNSSCDKTKTQVRPSSRGCD